MKTVRLVHAIASTMLSYPDESVLATVPSLRAAMISLPDRFAAPLTRTLEFLTTPRAAEHYVAIFDLRRRCSLHLTYYTHGDTRERGAAMLRFRQVYQDAGMRMTDDELPDHLAVVLEFSAAGHTRPAIDLLTAHRPGVELLGRALTDLGSPYADTVAVVRSTLPAPAAGDVRAARRLAVQGPPAEQVGR